MRQGGGSETAKNDDQLTKIAKVSKFLDQIGKPSGEKLDPRYGRWKSWRETANLRILQVSEHRGKKRAATWKHGLDITQFFARMPFLKFDLENSYEFG